MINSLYRTRTAAADEKELERYEPIYGLPKNSLDEWLACNPLLKQEYQARLRAFQSRYQR
ncbi:hypothetical protein ETAA8_18280 [Anatilimnocola aggregata]|uniref:Uncharacterized protein n=1 Tax=Anatilimnocola aggregata TaxID=2528021 RepID=A0A517Y924_9BACT|nr:hypothetical protein [Anatilimnocola aggregata]QDU26747.1 hypothetical protein ETAA8_18280 [Anatilimnocola aggregata]